MGDQKFRHKCAHRLEQFLRDGGTLVMATHDQEEVRRFADQVLWFEHGRVVMEGSADAVLKEYNAPDEEESDTLAADSPQPDTGARHGEL